MNKKNKLRKLNTDIKNIYLKEKNKLLFHGWHHINFVKSKAVEFSKSIKADSFIVESAALVHDLNYLVKVNSNPEVGEKYRKKILLKHAYSQEEIERIEKIILEAHIAYRNKNISKEGMALSDADSLFKVLPITPVIFSSFYITQNKIDIQKLAKKITSEQNKLLKSGLYFYTKPAKKYTKWVKTNLKIWNDVMESLEDKNVQMVLKNAKKLSIL